MPLVHKYKAKKLNYTNLIVYFNKSKYLVYISLPYAIHISTLITSTVTKLDLIKNRKYM